MKRILLPAVLGFAALASGCASIINGSEHPVSITSEPSGAEFEVRDSTGIMVHRGVTPNTVTLKSGAGYFKPATYSVKMHKEGYGDTVSQLRGSVSGWYWGNLVFGGLIGFFAVDPATGAMFKLPEASNAVLAPEPSVPLADAKH